MCAFGSSSVALCELVLERRDAEPQPCVLGAQLRDDAETLLELALRYRVPVLRP